MSVLPTRNEKEVGRPFTPLQIFDITAARETTLSRLLMLYISTGLLFMLLPGTFLEVWNLLAISSRRAADSVSAGWIQAHGHAQIFGWIGTFILGIGFYSIPKLRRLNSFALSAVWSSWALWTSGVTLRWLIACTSGSRESKMTGGMSSPNACCMKHIPGHWPYSTIIRARAITALPRLLVFIRDFGQSSATSRWSTR
ncbi:MAG: hypothetical protein WCA27_25495 [Candidatus Sulfotelmatobacter sp.]